MKCSLVGGPSRKKKSEEAEEGRRATEVELPETVTSHFLELFARLVGHLDGMAETQKELLREQRRMVAYADDMVEVQKELLMEQRNLVEEEKGKRKAMEEWLWYKKEKKEREEMEETETEGEVEEGEKQKEVEDVREEAEKNKEEMEKNEGDRMVE
jgi:hypothetical protein